MATALDLRAYPTDALETPVLRLAHQQVKGVPNGIISPKSPHFFDGSPTRKTIVGFYHEKGYSVVDAAEEFNWFEEVHYPGTLGDLTQHVPGVAVPLYFLRYRQDPQFRTKIREAMMERVRSALSGHDKVFLTGHSHGTVIICDAIAEMERNGELDSREAKLYLILLGPALGRVCGGLISETMSAHDMDRLIEAVDGVLAIRVRTDLLSAQVLHEQNHASFEAIELPPQKREVGIWGHSTVMHRPDAQAVVRSFLEKVA